LNAKNEPELAATAKSFNIKISFLHKAFKTCENVHTNRINDINDKTKSCASKRDT